MSNKVGPPEQQVQFAPFRPIKDAIGQAENYAVPNVNDLARLSNRITNNLLYYQTNYFLLFATIFAIISMINPLQFVLGILAFVSTSTGILYAANKNPDIQRFKRDKPYVNLMILMLAGAFLFKLFGSLIVFLFSICMPLTVIFSHAAMRTRNLKNKLSNKIENIGLARTPMGVLLEQLGATNEAAS